MPTNVLVAFYSSYGHVHKLAQAVADGAKAVADTDVRLRRISELEAARIGMSKQPAYVQAQEAMKNIPECTHDDLRWANGICWGTPTRFGNMTAQGAYGTIQLTDQEVRLLKIFIANRGKPMSRKVLLEVGWGYSGETTTRTVDNFIVRLRKYFENDPENPVYFKSIRSIGYIFDHQ